MITEKTKAVAVAKLRQRVPAQVIADEMELPLKLIEDWQGDLSPNDTVRAEANLIAVQQISQRVSTGELVEEANEAVLKNVLEETAIDIAKQSSIPGISGDMVHAKAIQLCADAVVKLYQTIILKGGNGPQDSGKRPNSQVLDVFENMMKD